MDQYEPYVKAWRLRREAHRRKLMEHKRLAREEAERLTRVLAEEFHVRRVLLVGSLSEGERFHRGSDIDLVVDGLQADLFFKAVGKLLRISSFDVDLKPLDAMQPSVRARFEAKGVVLYDEGGN